VSYTETPTFTWESATDPDPGDAVTYRFLLGTTPALDNPIIFEGLTDTTFTIPDSLRLVEGAPYYWQVHAVDQTYRYSKSVPSSWSLVVDLTATSSERVPVDQWSLQPVYPNPFNPVVQISYSVPSTGGRVVLAVYDAQGALVRTLINEDRSAGIHQASWDGRDDDGVTLASGVYFVRLQPPDGSRAISRKAVLLK